MPPPVLSESAEPLAEAYDLIMLDLDGVVYVGGQAVPGAVESLRETARIGARRAFITNNASRPPEAVSDHLQDLGVAAEPSDVVTSAQAAARVLVEALGEGARVAMLGGRGLAEALEARGLVVVGVADDAAALATGYGPDVTWADVMRAAVRVRDGLWWVASNTDMTIPTAYGVAPGHGVLVETLQRFAGVDPVVAGKPERPLLDETVRRMQPHRALMVGDRLDTDIAGAHRADVDSLLVLTGVTGLAELVGARGAERPTYLSVDLGGLLEPCGSPQRTGAGWSLGGWEACVDDADPPALEVSGEGSADDWWRVVAACAWQVLDETDRVVDTSRLEPPEPSDR